jgi:hypothetical protein
MIDIAAALSRQGIASIRPIGSGATAPRLCMPIAIAALCHRLGL